MPVATTRLFAPQHRQQVAAAKAAEAAALEQERLRRREAGWPSLVVLPPPTPSFNARSPGALNATARSPMAHRGSPTGSPLGATPYGALRRGGGNDTANTSRSGAADSYVVNPLLASLPRGTFSPTSNSAAGRPASHASPQRPWRTSPERRIQSAKPAAPGHLLPSTYNPLRPTTAGTHAPRQQQRHTSRSVSPTPPPVGAAQAGRSPRARTAHAKVAASVDSTWVSGGVHSSRSALGCAPAARA